MMFFTRNYKSYNIDKICDIFLKELFKAESKNLKPLCLPELLEKKKIFFDKEIVAKTIGKLKSKRYIKEDLKNKIRHLYLPAGMNPSQDFAETVKNTCGEIVYYGLDDAGVSFVNAGQKFEKRLTDNRSYYQSILIGALKYLIISSPLLITFHFQFFLDLNIFVYFVEVVEAIFYILAKFTVKYSFES